MKLEDVYDALTCVAIGYNFEKPVERQIEVRKLNGSTLTIRMTRSPITLELFKVIEDTNARRGFRIADINPQANIPGCFLFADSSQRPKEEA